MAWINVPKPTGPVWTGHNPQGKEQYDESDIFYDDITIFYDSIDMNQWNSVSKPTTNVWNKIIKPI